MLEQTSTASLNVPTDELDLDQVLMSGQTFRWNRDDQRWWSAVVGPGAALRLRRSGESIECQAFGANPAEAARDYLRLECSLAAMRESWLAADEGELATAIEASPGLRIVRQDPVECLFSFLCSSAAPIHRIRRSVDGLCKLLGEPLGEWHGAELRAFPELESLAHAKRSALDLLGLGFRGRYVAAAAAEILVRGGRKWLVGLREAEYGDAKKSLMELSGIGEKVADCVCLFSLDKDAAVPIDVHMARVARRLFRECGIGNTLTPKRYAIAANCFRQRYGSFAGWAQQYFFFSEIATRGLWDQNIVRHRPRQRKVID